MAFKVRETNDNKITRFKVRQKFESHFKLFERKKGMIRQ